MNTENLIVRPKNPTDWRTRGASILRYIEELENALSKANGVIIGQQQSIDALNAALKRQ
jgi:hypothetical protein